MSTLRFGSVILSPFHKFRSKLTEPQFSSIAVLSSLFLSRTCTSTTHAYLENHILFKFLIDTVGLKKQRALMITMRFSHIKSTENPQLVTHLFKIHGFSDTQIKMVIHKNPQLLLIDTEKVLKPKLKYFEGLGMQSLHLGMCISKNPSLLTSSLDKGLKPCIELIKKFLEVNRDETSKRSIDDDMFCILSRYSWGMSKNSRLPSNIKYLESFGIVGSQVVMLLKREPRLLSISEEELKSLISRAMKLGFMIGSRMLVYGVLACRSISTETLNRKYKFFQSFGFSKNECAKMISKAPMLLKSSEAKLRCAIEFFLHTLRIDKPVLVCWSSFLLLSMEKRILPRYRVLKRIESRRLQNPLPRISTLLTPSEEKFVEKYILRFKDESKELLLAYKGHDSTSSKE